jgi:hypothetical protein
MPQNADFQYSQLSLLQPPLVLTEALFQASARPSKKPCEARPGGLGSSEEDARMRARPSESPVSIWKAFPRSSAKRNRPEYARPELKRRMTSPRVQLAISTIAAQPHHSEGFHPPVGINITEALFQASARPSKKPREARQGSGEVDREAARACERCWKGAPQ